MSGVKKYIRAVKGRFGLLSEAERVLQLDKIYPGDIFLVSYPRSGNTWLRFILAYLKTGFEKEITFADLERIVPGVYGHHEYINTLKAPRIIKAHHFFPDDYPKVLYIYRDYRDVLVSFYNYQRAHKVFQGTFSEFIRSDDRLSMYGSWKEHIKMALAYKDKYPANSLLISYEQLMQDPVPVVRQIAAFCGIKTDINFETLSRYTSFEALRAVEDKYDSKFKSRTNEHFMRQGKSGTWQQEFSADDIAYLQTDKELVTIMETLGYIFL